MTGYDGWGILSGVLVVVHAMAGLILHRSRNCNIAVDNRFWKMGMGA